MVKEQESTAVYHQCTAIETVSAHTGNQQVAVLDAYHNGGCTGADTTTVVHDNYSAVNFTAVVHDNPTATPTTDEHKKSTFNTASAIASFIAPLLRPVIKDRSLTDGRYSAYQEKDVEASKLAHASMFGTVPTCKKVHLKRDAMASSDFLRAIVFGGLDGINSIFATIAACQGAQLSATQTLTVGLCNLLANAIAMGFGEYLSAAAEEEFVEKERQKEEWELNHCPAEEKREMVEIYEHRWGFSKEDAQTVIDISSRYPNFFISHMMAEELGLLLPDDSENAGATPTQKGLVMYFSFGVFGLIPLLSFWLLHTFILIHFNLPHWTSFVVSGVLSCLALFVLGIVKSRFLAAESPALTGLYMLLNGGGAGLVAFLVGFYVQKLFGNSAAVVD
eukprot:Lankesteria_metandrocarpae@DN10386_c0_g1_i1.p1